MSCFGEDESNAKTWSFAPRHSHRREETKSILRCKHAKRQTTRLYTALANAEPAVGCLVFVWRPCRRLARTWRTSPAAATGPSCSTHTNKSTSASTPSAEPSQKGNKLRPKVSVVRLPVAAPLRSKIRVARLRAVFPAPTFFFYLFHSFGYFRCLLFPGNVFSSPVLCFAILSRVAACGR